jgi:RNA 2',3'-cyclic 3'-phosphodiesterase
MRLFIAIELPEYVRNTLHEIQNALSPEISARWVPETQLHLTLKFIGETPDADLPRIVDGLSTITIDNPLELRICGVICFPPQGRIRIIAAALEDADGRCAKLQAKIDAACHAADIPLDGRVFEPHITLARLTDCATFASRDRVAGLVAGIPTGDAFHIQGFSLIESRLSKEGSRYVTIASFAQ